MTLRWTFRPSGIHARQGPFPVSLKRQRVRYPLDISGGLQHNLRPACMKPSTRTLHVPHQNQRWSDSEKEKLLTMLSEGETADKVANKLQRSRGSINACLFRMRVEEPALRHRLRIKPGRQPGPWTPWNKDDDSRLLALRAAGHDFAAIAEMLSPRTVTSVCRRYYHLAPETIKRTGRRLRGGRSITWTAEEDATVRSMRTAGHTFEQIASNLGRTYQGIYSQLYSKRFKKISQSRPHQLWTRDDEAKLLRMYHEGLTKRQISAQLKRSLNAIDQRLRSLIGLQKPKPISTRKPKLKGSNGWTPEETAKLCRLRDDENLDWDEIRKQMPQRTQLALQIRYFRTRTTEASPNRLWDPDSDAKLLALAAAKAPWAEIMASFPTRTHMALRVRARHLKARSG